jgi:signal transduction histidine kinase
MTPLGCGQLFGEIKTIVADIKHADQRATEVIQRLRRLLTKARVEARNIDLNEVAREVIGILAAQAAAQGITVNAVLSTDSPIVKGDRVQLEQVILNLVANAIDALAETPGENRRITVRTVLLDDNKVELSVSDTGPGIRPDGLKQIFEPFFTTKESGMGMGLSIARTIVEVHGGRLWAEPTRRRCELSLHDLCDAGSSQKGAAAADNQRHRSTAPLQR